MYIPKISLGILIYKISNRVLIIYCYMKLMTFFTSFDKKKHSQQTVGRVNERKSSEKKSDLFFDKIPVFDFRKKTDGLKLQNNSD